LHRASPILYLLEEAIMTAPTPPYGPAHLIIPYNVFNYSRDIMLSVESYSIVGTTFQDIIKES
jgi:thiamine pyrophosphate-dependent acetolactate synthase large subunit-like protein